MSTTNEGPILMEEAYWANSYFSIARHYGGVRAFGHEYTIVNKDGVTIFELSDPASPHYVVGNAKAIPPGEPADLVMAEWIPTYRRMGREAFIEHIRTLPLGSLPPKEAKANAKANAKKEAKR